MSVSVVALQARRASEIRDAFLPHEDFPLAQAVDDYEYSLILGVLREADSISDASRQNLKHKPKKIFLEKILRL